jgi:hypothetical protein
MQFCSNQSMKKISNAYKKKERGAMSLSIISTVPTESELKSYRIIAEVAAANPHWKKQGGSGSIESVVANLLSIMLLARELGLSPIQAISGGINNVNGKFEISARNMNLLIRKFGHTLKVKNSTNEICTIYGKRKDTGEEMEVSYHIEEAKRSGLVKPNSAWEKVPSDMLFARVISRLARRLFADCIGGCYIEGELDEAINGKPVKPDQLEDVTALKDEIEIKAPEPAPVLFDLPESVNPEAVQAFISQSAEKSKKPVDDVVRAANQNPTGFLSAYYKWWEPQAKPVILEGSIFDEECAN